MTSLKKLGILLSGRGSNFEAIAGAIADGRLQAEIAIVVSNRAEAPGLAAARRRGLNARLIPSQGRRREEHDAEVVAALREANVDLVCLAGYMRLLSPEFVAAFPQRILNIHPSLLPAFPGLDAQKQALEYGAKISGCTVHFVDEHLDHGPIVLQKSVPVLEDDDVASLAARILQQEHLAYPEAIAEVLAGGIAIEGRRVVHRRGEARNQPLLRVKLLDAGARAPTVAHPGEDLGYDIYAAQALSIPAKGNATIPTGIAVECRSASGERMGALLRDKSSMAVRRLVVTGGVIDAGYRGEIRVLMENLGESPAVIHSGDKIANLVPYPVLTGEVRLTDELGGSQRQTGGFGSTGR